MAGRQSPPCDWQPRGGETSGLGTQEGQPSMHWLHWCTGCGEFRKTEVPLTPLISCPHRQRQRASFLSPLESKMQDNGPVIKDKTSPLRRVPLHGGENHFPAVVVDLLICHFANSFPRVFLFSYISLGATYFSPLVLRPQDKQAVPCSAGMRSFGGGPSHPPTHLLGAVC